MSLLSSHNPVQYTQKGSKVEQSEVSDPLFRVSDLEIFQIPAFSDRMTRLRSEISPKLLRLGESLIQPLSKLTGEDLYIHLAKHLRRTVNPPVTTWVAFARTKRAYKPTVHFRVALSGEGLRTTVFVEDYAEDKLKFAEALCSNASEISEHLLNHPAIKSYSIPDMVSKADELHMGGGIFRRRRGDSCHSTAVGRGSAGGQRQGQSDHRRPVRPCCPHR